MSFFTLKTIALLSMLWDHLTYVWPLSLTLETLFCPNRAEGVRWIEILTSCTHYLGRIAAPIFLFSIANGFRHTRSRKKYALRLLVFACLAEWPYYHLFGFHGNILFTLLLGLLTLQLMEWGNRKKAGLGYLLATTAVIAAELLDLAEGGGRYLLFILVFFLTGRWPLPQKFLLWLVLMPLSRYGLARLILTEGLLSWRWLHMWSVNALGPLLGVALTFRYNGKKGPSFPGGKYLWYIFYPAHLLILGLIRPATL